MIDNKKNNFDIISFSGRKESGKTELASVCESFGYEKKSFATPLKKLVCDLTGLESIWLLNKFKTKPLGVCVDEKVLEKLSKSTGIDYQYCKNTSAKLTVQSTARDWLQVIGTDVIRSCDQDWHVRKTIQTIEPGKKYVFDDTRFKNELDALKNLGAECWFIIRNKVDNISNHISETSLDYRMFDYHVIVNNIELDNLRKRWKTYVECHDVIASMRKWAIEELLTGRYIPISESTLNKFFVYNWFRQFKKKSRKPVELIENDFKDGFVGDNGNPFITEDWKRLYGTGG